MAGSDSKRAENDYLLQQAEYFLSSQPSQTFNILNNQLTLSTLSVQQKINWYLLNTTATVFTNQLDEGQSSLEQLFLLIEHTLFYDQLSLILSTTGVWLRKSAYLNDAEATLTCALKQPAPLAQQLRIKISLAIIARHQTNYSRAEALYKEAYQIAEELKSERAFATIENNLGTLAFDKGQLKEADRYFRKALAGNQLQARRSGHINSGINLLFIFLLQKEFVNYQRLYGPISQLLKDSQDQSKQAYLLWVNSGYQAAQGQTMSQNLKTKLSGAFNKLEGNSLKRLVQIHLAAPLNIEVTLPEQTVNKTFNAPWFEQVRLCNW